MGVACLYVLSVKLLPTTFIQLCIYLDGKRCDPGKTTNFFIHFYKLQQDHGSIFAGLALLISPFSTGDLIIAALPWKLYPATLQSRKAILCFNDTGLRLGGAIKDCFIVPQNRSPKGSCLNLAGTRCVL